MPDLVTAFGTSSPLFYWGVGLVGKLLKEVYLDYCHIHCLTRESLRQQWENRNGRIAFVTSDRPDPDLTALLVAFDYPIIAFVDNPEDAIDSAIRTRDPSCENMCRFSTQLFSSLEPALTCPKVLIVGTEWQEQPLHALVRELSRVIFGETNENAIARLVAEAVPNGAGGDSPTVWQAVQNNQPAARPPLRGLDELAPEQQRLIKAISDTYRPILQGQRLARVEWPTELFFREQGAGSADGLDLLGMARHLVWGPYLHLPIGYWQAEVEFEIADNFSGNVIETDIRVGAAVVSVQSGRLPVLGIYQYRADFAVTDLSAPIEVRIRMLTGAIEGRFGLRRVGVVRREPKAEELPSLIAVESVRQPVTLEGNLPPKLISQPRSG